MRGVGGRVGSGDGAGKLSVPGRLTIWRKVGQGPAVLALH